MKIYGWTGGILVGLGGLVLWGWAIAAEPPAEEVHRRPSTYAPVPDLESQVQFFLDRLQEDLADEAQYTDARIKRVTRDAHTLAVLALLLGKHDEGNSLRACAPVMLERALKLAEVARDYPAAQRAYADLLASRQAQGDAAALAWSCVGDIVELMHQVPALNTNLRGIVRSESRFASTGDRAAGLAVTLAAIAHVSMFDESYCVNAADRSDWVEWCILMRDAAYDVNRAVRAGTQEQAVELLKPLTRTCDGCHEKFKP